ncbi:type II toxin-antitoxin system HigB family toxin [Phreatobacter oligotrophus]|uniref:mRNA interferase HigB n=1 Tax=Phreatobacter oligotrophus TaxID=1122261 RepID=A0A2T4ZF17_9HYPH|nr:type II toxin-antitoxin system HigB family toxin [Phreatobacter oligotrophus]PTM60488.1 mRNA interferase HigB [Phreatobacter oligotrophus]
MRIIARSTLVAFADRPPPTAASVDHWQRMVRRANWATPQEVQAAFSKAKVLSGDRVRFEVSGGDFRLVVAFRFDLQIAFVKFIGSHAEYDRIDALTVSQY